jgi:hypothetical protein
MFLCGLARRARIMWNAQNAPQAFNKRLIIKCANFVIIYCSLYIGPYAIFISGQR